MTFEHPDNKIAAVLQNMQSASETLCRLSFAEVTRFYELIETPIIERYAGDLERHECEDGTVTYTPLDTDTIRELLITLWGDLVSETTINGVYDDLITDGAEQWPRAHCEEDIAYERKERLTRLDHDIECTETHLAELKQEARTLLPKVKRDFDM
jgi:hypothetical protein